MDTRQPTRHTARVCGKSPLSVWPVNIALILIACPRSPLAFTATALKAPSQLGSRERNSGVCSRLSSQFVRIRLPPLLSFLPPSLSPRASFVVSGCCPWRQTPPLSQGSAFFVCHGNPSWPGAISTALRLPAHTHTHTHTCRHTFL